MPDWLTLLVIYIPALLVFRLFGNFAAAGELLQRWGRFSATPPADSASPMVCISKPAAT